jgi:hypothetical protein
MLPELSNMLTWWQWLLLGLVPPAVIALYFLKLKRRPLEVPSTYLWHKSIEDLHVNSIWQRLRRNLLLLLQLLVLLLAVLAILRPSWEAVKLEGSRFIFLVDNSASMQATDVEPSRLDEAKRRVGELLDQMRSGDAAMIISFSDTARVEQPFTNDRQRLREALAGIKPTPRSTSLAEALRLASGLANPGRSAEAPTDERVAEAMPAKLFIFSDGKFPAVRDFELGHLDPVFVPIAGSAPANVGIVAFSAGRQEGRPDKLQAFARIGNFGPTDVTVSLKLFLEGQTGEINADRLDVPAGQDRGTAFDLTGVESGVLRLEAGADKAARPAANTGTSNLLVVDDSAWTLLSPARRAKVLLVTPGDGRLVEVLTTKAAAELAEVRVEPPNFLGTKPYRDQAEGGALNLIIYDRCRPDKMPHANTFFLGRMPPEGGWSAKPKVTLPQIIDIEVSHPLIQWLDLSDLRAVVEASPLQVPTGGKVLVESNGGPLLALAAREGFEDAVLAFTLLEEQLGAAGKSDRYVNTDWPIRVSFTSFALNLLSYMGGRRDALEMGSVRPGAAVTLEAPDAHSALEIRTPAGKMIELTPNPSGKTVFSATEELGVYEVQAGGKRIQQFVANLADAAESDIRAAENPSLQIGYVEVAGEQSWKAGRREIWRELLWVGLAVLLAEWYIYMRRVHF